jgi:hypothetical protein
MTAGCSVCGADAEDTHHIEYQCQSDADGYFRDFHKNMKHNLMPLCKACHQKEHSGQIDIKGYVKTSEGVVVDVKDSQDSQDSAEVGDAKLDDEMFDKLREYVRRGKCHWYLRSAKTKTYKKCSDTRKILDKINKILWVKDLDDNVLNRLYDPSL